MPNRPKVIVALPDWAEGSLVASWLSENQFEPVHRTTLAAAAGEIQARTFDLLIMDSTWAVSQAHRRALRARGPAAPSILIGDPADGPATAANAQTMYLTRPIDLAVLSCFVSMAFMDGRPVRRSPRKTVQWLDAFVNDAPASILDVSPEGLRLQVARVPPPYFAVRIPALGVAAIAKRKWTMSQSKPASTLWCGGELSHHRAGSEDVWRSFVNTVPVDTNAGVRVNL
jgi:hypothetical protein